MRRCFIPFLTAALLCMLASCTHFSGGMNFAPHSNADVATSVQHAFETSNQFADVPITVEADHGNVRLSGYVKTIRQSDLAGALAQKVEGVKTVENNLIVRK